MSAGLMIIWEKAETLFKNVKISILQVLQVQSSFKCESALIKAPAGEVVALKALPERLWPSHKETDACFDLFPVLMKLVCFVSRRLIEMYQQNSMSSESVRALSETESTLGVPEGRD